MKNIKPIYSFTLKELYDNRSPNFIHHDSYTNDLKSKSPVILKYAYANTLVFDVKSSHFGEKVQIKGGTGTNQTVYKIFVLFEDFYTIGKDKDIDFEDAIDFALNYGDVHIRCNCPAFLYWGYAYIGTQLRYLYGVPRENRYPNERNPNVEGTICKHCDAVIQYCLSNKSLIAKMFAAYYDRLTEGQSIYAVNTNGNTITIGHKDGDGDIFFERQEEEMEDIKMAEEYLENKDKSTEDIDSDKIREQYPDYDIDQFDNILEDE